MPAAVSTLAKDLRWFREDRRFIVDDLLETIDGHDPVFVWQHHDLFLNGGTRLARRLEVPLVQFVDAMIVWEARRWGVSRHLTGGFLEQHGEYPALRSADLIACVTEEVAEHVAAAGVAEERIRVTPCTAEISDFVVPDSCRTEWRDRFGLHGHPVIGWVGSFRRFHALESLIEAMVIVLQRHARVRLLIVGDGPQRQQVLDRAAELGVEGAVIAPGLIPHKDIPKVMAAMDIAVLTASAHQPFHYSPLKLREYLAAGKPVVAPAIGDPARILDHGLTGRLYPPGNATALASEIASLITDPRQAASIASAGQEMHRRTGQIDVQLDELVAALKLA